LEGPRNVSVPGYRGVFDSIHVDRTYSFKEFVENFRIIINEVTDEIIRFEMIGIDVSLANALRRILISEIPTMAIETVRLYQNTGTLQDEVLCHRLGLIPFKVEPSEFSFRTENEDLSSANSLKFKLHIKCEAKDIDPHLNHYPLHSSQLEWVPMTTAQKDKFKNNPPVPVHKDILITKMRPGQEIEAECFVEKGIGKDHSKWSAVCPAYYKLLPKFKFPAGDITGADAQELKNVCPMKVFDIEESTGKCFAARPRDCTTCRACIERFPERVQLTKIKDHFLFSVETFGSIPPETLLERAIDVMMTKLETMNQNLNIFLPSEEMRVEDDDDEDDDEE